MIKQNNKFFDSGNVGKVVVVIKQPNDFFYHQGHFTDRCVQ